MANMYSLISQNSTAEPVFFEEADEHRSGFPNRRIRASTYAALFSLSLIANVVMLGMWQSTFQRTSVPSKYGEGIEMPIVYKNFWWDTEYGASNHTEQDALWDAIIPSHGIIAVDRQWAASQNWPESMRLPQDETKGVYLLEAYHQLHCLKILHKTMREALTGQPFTWEPDRHIEHCFDTLRQTAMCNADSTPLYSFGDNTAGDGQLHKCRDWNALRDWASENSACYRDTIEDVLLGQHFGYCDDGHDGLIEAHPIEGSLR